MRYEIRKNRYENIWFVWDTRNEAKVTMTFTEELAIRVCREYNQAAAE